jgi:hypothetical protein
VENDADAGRFVTFAQSRLSQDAAAIYPGRPAAGRRRWTAVEGDRGLPIVSAAEELRMMAAAE